MPQTETETQAPGVAPPLLEIKNLTVALPDEAERPFAVEKVRYTLNPDEILCVVGESGSGKSVTAHAIMGLLPKPDLRIAAGRILYRGQNIVAMSEAEQRALRGHRIAMIFQEPMTALNPLMRVGDQIEEALIIHTDLDRKARKARVVEMLDAVGLPSPETLRKSYPFRLSGGQRQRVMIAMALALKPDILIADEPTTALDVTTQKQILDLIKTIQREHKMAVLFITHDFGVVAEIADRVAVMRHGRVVELGPAQEVLTAPKAEYTRALIDSLPHGRPTDATVARGGPALLAAEGVTKVYRSGGTRVSKRTELVVSDNIYLTIHPGETVGLVGESGSGKSTLARAIVGLLKPDGGRILFQGTDLLSLDRAGFRPFRRHVQMVFQDPYASLNPRHKVAEIIAQGPIAFGTPRAEALARARELLGVVGLDASAGGRYPHEFSGGQRQRISIARALAMEPQLLIADEPVSALDASVQAQVLDLLADIKAKLNLAMLFITHDLRVAAQICDTVGVMQHGRIVEYGAATEVFGHPTDPYTRALLDAIPGQAWHASHPPSGGPPS
ncbi:ABC transporter ATP-binding protein [Roseospira marina]|uniref:ABC transporter ATP-binding protein n=1 Tax=Roseospira marina TaxID=140057 RepID=A0A5M6IDP9_9PROT|nr:ABC transporter ATP-binding protein [Roseospira marina]KAA5606411.1 ABC transporter ATP-binding protein [Roseospira marina]MBB4314178.1 peptide/nickel transport system ATP-binding protein [Roseospira marina]MBB5087339.1 peptide/nickel transport system ATP-binding protein [Roseospira marina]